MRDVDTRHRLLRNHPGMVEDRWREADPRTELEWFFFGAESEWYSSGRVSQDLPALATKALEAGWDTPTLRVLAGEPSNAYPPDLAEAFAQVLEELGQSPPSQDEATKRLVQFFSWQISTKRLSAIDGAKRIEKIGWGRPSLDVIATFMGLVDEWEGGWGRSRSDVEQSIRDLAEEVLHSPSRR